MRHDVVGRCWLRLTWLDVAPFHPFHLGFPEYFQCMVNGWLDCIFESSVFKAYFIHMYFWNLIKFATVFSFACSVSGTYIVAVYLTKWIKHCKSEKYTVATLSLLNVTL